jgi:acyl-CoA hydrolase
MEQNLSSEPLAGRVNASETRTAKVVAPGTTNSYNTLSGGTLLGWMDEIAAIAASRFSRYPVVTASLDRIDFKHPIPAGSIVEMVARVTRLGRTSLQLTVDVYVEYLHTTDRLHAVTGLFTMVAIGEDKRPVPIKV